MERYIYIKKTIKALEAELETLKPLVEEKIPTEGLETEDGKFSWTTRKEYTYSPNVVEKTLELKTLKKEEELTAPFTEVKVLTFKSN